jgi:hypothetical protein
VGEILEIMSHMAVPFERQYHLAFDFDGNMGDTFTPSPDGVGVEENYIDTLGQIFGPDILATYLEQGLDNRAPSEVICDLAAIHPDVTQKAKAHLEQNLETLSAVMPRTVGKLATWDTTPRVAATEVYIRQDLINSLHHIGLPLEDGRLWPLPCTGFDSFWRAIQDINEANDRFNLTTSVISSGYDEYIDKVFRVAWELPSPDIWVTDDFTRSRPHPVDHLRRVKPAPLGIALAHHAWLKKNGLTGKDFDLISARHSKQRMAYFGDGAEKDGQMAARARVGFGLFNATTKGIVNGQYTEFGDWRDLEDRLLQAEPELRNGRPLSAALGLIIPEIEYVQES